MITLFLNQQNQEPNVYFWPQNFTHDQNLTTMYEAKARPNSIQPSQEKFHQMMYHLDGKNSYLKFPHIDNTKTLYFFTDTYDIF